ncbi:nucleotidyltransferase domain-containing protein [Lysinibacillus sp. fls2-241-R2A-57]|uniref:nucleotidyltransferase domain-containing protein n=1 Tax=Lysinibacillus sp. fls2-241-R2A-57 TaxID=3040292 RepID=UPI002554E76C|nr:nucleotidyltransferase domain-containing protein [Lysinibacillus sp. fls2-241-R2A-57]
MKLDHVVEVLLESLKDDQYIEAVFLRGSMARDEHDEFSDIDMYCVVKEENIEVFLPNRNKHIKTYKQTLFIDDIYIIAPQLLVVYEDMIHIDLFTVTPTEISNKDAIKVLFDPNGILTSKQRNTTLSLSPLEFQDAVDDTVWYLYQYYLSAKRGNAIWCVHLLRHSLEHFAKVLLHKYCPERASLGLKALHHSLPPDRLDEFVDIMNCMSLVTYEVAVKKLVNAFHNESSWIFDNVPDQEEIKPLWEKIKELLC